jgi:tetratricopeptide (TPR) repeat protein
VFKGLTAGLRNIFSHRYLFPAQTLAIIGSAALIIAPSLPGQDTSNGNKIYKESANSILLLYAKSPSGELIAQGSGFLVAGNRIVTNEHVADAGTIFVQVGPARIPAKVEKLDRFNDLAILTVDVEITAKPLNLAQKSPAPGDPVYAIGNPEGLEKTITQGVISSVRELDGRKLIQVSAPLSHGSSGGPLFNSAGDVVGVAVGILESGQNLNFAIPASIVAGLMRSEKATQPSDALATMEEVEKLNADQRGKEYSQAADSPYQAIETKIRNLLNRAYEEAGTDPSLLVKVATLARSDDIDLSIKAAQRSNELKPSASASLAYAESVYWKSIFLKDDEKTPLLREAEKAAKGAISSARPPTIEMYNTLAEILEDAASTAEADRNFRIALSLPSNNPLSDDYLQALRGVIRTSYALKNRSDSQRLFDQLVSTGKASSYDWSAQGERLNDQFKYEEAAVAYSKAAAGGGEFGNWCSAALNYSVTSKQDLTLSSARACIDGGTGQPNANSKLSTAHEEISSILNTRGVYLEALNHAKEAASLNPTNAFAYDDMSEALLGLRRFEEAVNASEQGIRISDGKYWYMHFHLGQAYFDLENWEFARQSFEKAAELNTSDSASAYNLALCFARLKYYLDSAKWYEEYLRRNPNAPDKNEILTRIQTLRN